MAHAVSLKHYAQEDRALEQLDHRIALQLANWMLGGWGWLECTSCQCACQQPWHTSISAHGSLETGRAWAYWCKSAC
jgi:hypothetical protein